MTLNSTHIHKLFVWNWNDAHSETNSHSHIPPFDDHFVVWCVAYEIMMCHFSNVLYNFRFFISFACVRLHCKQRFCVIDYDDNKYTWPSLIALGYINFSFDIFEPHCIICTQDVKEKWTQQEKKYRSCDEVDYVTILMINMPSHRAFGHKTK